MARYSSHTYGNRTGQARKWIYIILTLSILAGGIFFVFGDFRKSKPETEQASGDNVIAEQESPPEVYEIEQPSPQPSQTSEDSSLGIADGNFETKAEPDPKVAKIITEATNYLAEQPAKIIDARNKLNDALLLPMSQQQRAFIKEQLSQLSEQWLFSKRIFTQDSFCGSYRVQRGESLTTIGRQFRIPYETLMLINNISRPQLLRAGQTIKVANGPFHAVVHRSLFTMDIYLQNVFVKSYNVGLGSPSKQTPTGLWQVKPGGKLQEPIWTDPDTGKVYHHGDPNYPLGSVWVELQGVEGDALGQPSYGIHGTNEPESIGTASSRGCIRLHNGDAVQVYNLLEPTYSQVRVVE